MASDNLKGYTISEYPMYIIVEKKRREGGLWYFYFDFCTKVKVYRSCNKIRPINLREMTTSKWGSKCVNSPFLFSDVFLEGKNIKVKE